MCKTNCHIAQAGLEHYPPASASASMQIFDFGSYSCPLPFLQGLVPSLASNPDLLYHVNHSGTLRLPMQLVYLAANSASGNVIKCGDMLNSYVLLGLIF